ncbi:sporozoite surface protein 2-like [Anthonomus grandis grandis]|uniref:sporozoite surface protein 2-like n=1 Tax=Anthonomus grandis grandis TaxID=2921223 RepID=UPI00216632FB|nr:sporozoite surface protein 2-like [Anthonomus grandis grandis]XP_050315286.1 sporozoite surface protein 2-like [Anthonomus grandis grandis]
MNVDEIAQSLEALMEFTPSEPQGRKASPTQPNPNQPTQPNPNQPTQPNPNQPTQPNPNQRNPTQPNNQENYNRWRQRGRNWRKKRLERQHEQSVLHKQKVLLSVVTDAMASVASAVLKHTGATTSGYQWRGGSRRGRGRGRGRGRVE